MTQTSNPLQQFFRQPALYIRLPSEGRQWPPGSINMPPNQEIPVLPMNARQGMSRGVDISLDNALASALFRAIFSTGIDSPVIADWSTALRPSLTVPSTAQEARERLDRVLRVGGVRAALIQAARDLPDASKGPALERTLQQATGFLVLPIKETVLVAAE